MPAPKNFPPPPKGFNYEKGLELEDALQIMLPKELGLSDAAAKNELKTKNYSWRDPKELSDYIKEITGQGNVKDAEYVLSQWQENFTQIPEYAASTMTGAPEYPVETTTLTPDQLKQLQEENEAKEAKRKATVEHAETNVGAGIKRQQEIYAEQIKKVEAAKKEFEKQTKYARVQEVKLADEQQTQIEDLREQSKANPQETVKVVSLEIKNRLGDSIPQAAADVAAFEVVSALGSNYTPVIQAGVAETASKEAAAKGEKEVAEWIATLSGENQGIDLSKQIISMAFGQEFTNVTLPEVEVTNTPGPDFVPVSLAYIPVEASKAIESKVKILNEPFLQETDYANKWFGSQLALMQGDRTVTQRELYFSTFKPQGRVDWQGIGGQSKLNIVSGASEPLKAIGAVAGGVAKQVVTKAVVSKITTAIGTTVGGPVGTAVGAVVGWVADKIPWDKVKKWSLAAIGILTAGVGLILGIPGVLALGAGIGIFGGLGALGVTPAVVGSGVVGLLGAIGGATLGAIGPPILATLIGFPVVVALILFIINSGAYVVPPSPMSVNVFGPGVKVVCTDEKGSVGVAGPSSGSPIANRAWEITYDLYQGFWCFWNRSPSNVPWNGPPRQGFPKDVVKYPPNYPNLFDYALFAVNKNPPEASGPNLFWCTYLPIKAYQENHHSIPAFLGAQAMLNAWPKNKVILAADATPQNIVPGSVIFFKVPSHGPGIQHVGVVYLVDQSGITDVESNNAIKSERIVFSNGKASSCTPLCLKNATPQECGCLNSGHGVQGLPGMPIDSFGLP